MKLIRRAHVVVVADGDRGRVLAARLRQMAVAQVTAVTDYASARWLCQSGGADACIVALDCAVPDAAPIAEADAPGRYTRVPSLIVVPAATPYLRKMARRCGYMAMVPASIAPRTLYRRIGAVLQQRRAARKRHQFRGVSLPMLAMQHPATVGKPVLH